MGKRKGPQFIPEPQGKEVIWIHAVSVGETKSAQTLFQALKKDHPQAFFLITTTTAITAKIDLLGNSFSENDEIVSRIKIPPLIVEFIIKISCTGYIIWNCVCKSRNHQLVSDTGNVSIAKLSYVWSYWLCHCNRDSQYLPDKKI